VKKFLCQEKKFLRQEASVLSQYHEKNSWQLKNMCVSVVFPLLFPGSLRVSRRAVISDIDGLILTSVNLRDWCTASTFSSLAVSFPEA